MMLRSLNPIEIMHDDSIQFNQPHVLTRSQFDLFELWHASNFQDISAILEAGGISYEDSMIEEVCKRMEGKQVRQAGDATGRAIHCPDFRRDK